MTHLTRCTGSAEGSRAYYCGWVITGGSTVSHLVSAPSFPTMGSQHRSWCVGRPVRPEAINVRMAPGRILSPDLVVVTKPGLDLAVWDPPEVAMVVEIVSPGSVAADRAIKPQLYSAAGIEHYLRVELNGPAPSGAAYRLHREYYVEVASSRSGQVLCLAEPFRVDLDFAQLAAATGPSG